MYSIEIDGIFRRKPRRLRQPRYDAERRPTREARDRGQALLEQSGIAAKFVDRKSSNALAFLRLQQLAAQQAAAAHIPVLGVNAGRLGFLTQVQLGDEGEALDRWAKGDFRLQRRALLEARVGQRVFHALNDVVVHKGLEINLIRMETLVDDLPAGQFDADGVIVSTPTGSTGYALSLGGPIVHPDVRAIVFMPLNPHSLFNRPIILPEQARIILRLPNAKAILTCDGQQNANLDPGAEVKIAAPGLAVELVQFNGGPNFFELLRRKLRWGLPLVDGDE